MTDTFAAQMEKEAGELGLCLSKGQMEQFFRYYELLAEWNQVMNLTAITEEAEVVRKHFVDSLSLVKAVDGLSAWCGLSAEGGQPEEGALRVIDVGTGAGFPGIPLKIAFPRLQVTLLDSLNKRVKFLNAVCGELGLSGIQAVHGRAEDFGRMGDYREQFDLCVSRAVANMASLSEYCMPFVKIGGRFIPYKSGEIDEELAAAKKAVSLLGGELGAVVRFALPGGEDTRSLVVIEKRRPVPKKYPRKAGLPSKEPIR